ncbi:Uncharacterised protein [Weissella viridescens]|uniref:Uncharacterized protein n=1 Tax=Weissella viridescens TaxID=1629 RepID=A0A380NXT5_WEIVI|nr:Uncharacterised protein [Weissella viridescens]
MFNKMRVMLYVDDVQVISDFWQKYVKAEIAETNALPDDLKILSYKLVPRCS